MKIEHDWSYMHEANAKEDFIFRSGKKPRKALLQLQALKPRLLKTKEYPETK